MANRKLTHQEFIERLSIINPDITVTSEYNGMHEKIECRCNCRHEWTTSALSLANGHGCPKRFDDCRDQSTLPTDVISTRSSNLLNTKLGGVNTWQNQSA